MAFGVSDYRLFRVFKMSEAKKTRDEYLLELRQTVDKLKVHLKLPDFVYSDKEQDKVILHFLGRGVQIGDACYRVADLWTPIEVLSRVLCEDFLRMFWIMQSPENAAEYTKAATSGVVKAARVHLTRGRAMLRRKSTGEDVTATVLPEFSKLIVKEKTVEKMAIASGLGKLYDIAYRFPSLEVHGNTYRRRTDDEKGLLAAFPAIIAFLEAEILITDNRATTAGEVLRHMRIEKLAGK